MREGAIAAKMAALGPSSLIAAPQVRGVGRGVGARCGARSGAAMDARAHARVP